MDILETLQQKREVKRMSGHPLTYLSLNERYTYCFGLAVMAQGNIKTIEELAEPFHRIAGRLSISSDVCDEMIIDINNHFDVSMDSLIHLLSTERRISHCFLIDLITLRNYSSWGRWYCDEVIKQFCLILKISSSTKKFFENFIKAASDSDRERENALYRQFVFNDDTVDFDLVTYMDPGFSKKDHFIEMNLSHGGVVRIENETVVDGDIRVSGGTRLVIKNASLRLGGSIIINQGRVRIEGTEIVATGEKRVTRPLIDVSRVHFLTISDTRIDGSSLCPVIHQNSGSLRLIRCELMNSEGDCCIMLRGTELTMDNCQVRNCSRGGVKVLDRASADIQKCGFSECHAEHGGAIHISSMARVHIRECHFTDCTADFLGPAIYFKYKRYGQQVFGCTYTDSEPVQSHTFNAYEEK